MLSGSGEGHTAYFYKRLKVQGTYDDRKTPIVSIPGRKGFKDEVTGEEEADVQVYCDPAFLEGVKSAVGKVIRLRKETEVLMSNHMAEGRPKRTSSAPNR